MSPSPGINYNFIVGAYFVCTLILGVLFTLDKVGSRGERDAEIDILPDSVLSDHTRGR